MAEADRELIVLYVDCVIFQLRGSNRQALDKARAGLREARKAKKHAWQTLFEMRHALLHRQGPTITGSFKRLEQSLGDSFADIAVREVYAASLVFAEDSEGCETAAKLLREAIALCKGRFHFLVWLSAHRLADCLARLQRHSDAREATSLALSAAKEFENYVSDKTVVAVTHSNQGVFEFEEGNYIPAFRCFSIAHATDEHNRLTTDEGNLSFLRFFIADEFKNLLDEVTQKITLEKVRDEFRALPENDRTHAYNKALIAMIDGDFEEAARLFQTSADRAAADESDVQAAFSSTVTGYIMAEIVKRDASYRRGVTPVEDSALGDAREEALAAREFFKAVSRDASLYIPRMLNELGLHHRHLLRRRVVKKDDNTKGELIVLRRWNSYTPSIPLPPGRKGVGGGYFFHWLGTGVAVDPGFDFIENLYKEGFSVGDIDAIVLTHAHIDHTAEFDPLMTLIYERADKEGSRRAGRSREREGIHLLMNVGSSLKELGWLAHFPPRLIRRVDVMWPGKRTLIADHIEIDAVRAFHDDLLTREYSVGLRIGLRERKNSRDPACVLGITSDTQWDDTLADRFRDCDVLVAHLGSASFKEIACAMRITIGDHYDRLVSETAGTAPAIDDHKCRLLGFDGKRGFNHVLVEGGECSHQVTGEHLGFVGVHRIAKAFTGPLLVLSEFGEELGGFRTKIASVLNDLITREASETPFRAVTGDVGLKVNLCPVQVWDEIGEGYVDPQDILENCVPRQAKRLAYFSKYQDRAEVASRLDLIFDDIVG